MKDETDIAFAASLRNLAQPLEGAATDYDALLALLGDARRADRRSLAWTPRLFRLESKV